jgi:hypothetical protein
MLRPLITPAHANGTGLNTSVTTSKYSEDRSEFLRRLNDGIGALTRDFPLAMLGVGNTEISKAIELHDTITERDELYGLYRRNVPRHALPMILLFIASDQTNPRTRYSGFLEVSGVHRTQFPIMLRRTREVIRSLGVELEVPGAIDRRRLRRAGH